jgi:hypothetical protein
VLRRRFDLPHADLREREVAEGTASVPALVPLLGEQALRLGGGIDVLRLQPRDSRKSVSFLAASFGIEKVVGERLRVALREAEDAQPGQGVFGLQPD